MPNEDGKVKLNLSSKDQTTRDAGKAANVPEGERTHASVINVELINDQIKITGTDLDVVNKVTLDGDLLTIVSKSANELLLSSASQVTIALNTLLSLSLEDAYGATVISVTFNLPDSSVSTAKIGDDQVTTAKIADGAITAVKLDSMSATVGQLLRWNGTSWAASDLDALTYAGTWNAFVGGNPNPAAVGGEYYIVSIAGTADPGDGNSRAWSQGDWIIYNSNTSSWDQISNSSDVTSFNGRTGGVVPTTGDYTWAMINKSTSSIGDVADVDLSTAPTTGQVLKYDGLNWVASDDATGGAAGSVTSTTIADNSIVDADVNSSANISWSKINKTGATPSDIGLSNVTNDAQVKLSDLDTTITLGTDDTKVPSQNAVKTYVDNAISGFSSGTVTSITGGAALSDGPITTTGTLDVQVDGTTIEVASDALQLKDGGITDVKINASAAIAWTKIDKTGALKSDVGLGNVDNIQQLPLSYLSTVTTLGTSDVLVPSQNAVKTYVDFVAGAAGDDLGSHVATQDLDLATFKLVGNGGTNGLVISNTGVVTVSNDVVIGSNSVCQSDGTNCPTGNAGTVTSITGGAGLSDGPITSSGTLDVQVDGVTLEVNGSDALQLKDSGITNAKISASAAIDQSKINGLTTALSGKEDSLTAGTTAQYYRGDKTWQTLDKSAVGLSNLDNIQQMPLSYLSTVTTLGTSDVLVPSQNAVKTYVDNSITNYSVTNTDLSGISANCGVGQVITVNGSGDFVCFNPADYADNFFSSFGIGASPDASAALDVNSTTKGFLPPRMTTAQRIAIATPAEGLIVFDSDLSNLYIYKNAEWKTLTDNTEVSFSVNTTTAQSFGVGTWTKVVWDSENFDSNTNFTASRFTPTIPGKYLFFANIRRQNVSSNTTVAVGIFKNGVNQHYGTNIAELAAPSVMVTDILEANGTSDYFEVYYYTSTAGDLYVNDSMANVFTGVLLSGGTGGGSGAGADDLGDHTATQNLKLGNFYLSNDGGSEGLSIDTDGNSTFSGNVTATTFTGSGANLTDIPTAAISNGAITVDKVDFASSNGINIPQLTSDPVSGVAGQTYFNTTTNKLMFYNGSSWVEVGVGDAASFAVHMDSTNQSASTNTDVKMNWIAESFDTGNSFDLTTDRFVAPTTGSYFFTAQVYCYSTNLDRCGARFYKNGASVIVNNMAINSSGESMSTISTVLSLAANDYVEVYGNTFNGTAGFNGNPALTYFSGFKIAAGGSGGGLTTDSVSTAEIINGTIATADIADNAVTLSKVDFGSTNGLSIPQLASAPASPVAGQIYYNTTDNRLQVYTGSGWDELGASGLNGAISAWAVFNGNDGSIIRSSGISSITRNAVGHYSVSFTNSMSDTNYGMLSSMIDISAAAYPRVALVVEGTKTVNGLEVKVKQSGEAVYTDVNEVYLAFLDGPVSGASTIWTESGSNISRSTGKVAIGTTTPSAELTVVGAAGDYTTRFSGNHSWMAVEFENQSSSKVWEWAVAGNPSHSGIPVGSFYAWEQGNGEVMVIEPGGNVGIGTADPSAKLEVSGGNILAPDQVSFLAKDCSDSVSPGTSSILIWETVEHNVGSAYNATTGVFTAPVAGVYHFGFNTLMNNAGSGEFRYGFYYNGAHGNIIIAQKGANLWQTIQGTIIKKLNAGDTVDIRYTAGTGVSYNDCNYNSFWGRLEN